jgi:hypothetical protein
LGGSRSGAALVLTTLAIAAIAGLAMSLVAIELSSSREHRGSKEQIVALYVAEAGLSDGYANLQGGGDGEIGSDDAPVAFGGGSYWVESTDLGGGVVSLISTGVDDRTQRRLELVLREENDSIYRWGAFGDEGVSMSSNSKVDSYDSRLGTYASQMVNGTGSNAWALDHGNVGSNGSITMSQNSLVFGDVVPGPSGTATVIGNAAVSGSTTPAEDPQAMPPLDVPPIPATGPLSVPNQSTMTVAAGNYHWTSTTIGKGATLSVIGPATLVCDSLLLQSASALRVDATAGPVDIYVIDDFVLSSNTLVASTTYAPEDIRLHLQSDNVIDPDLLVDLDEIDFNSNSKLFGTIYAPEAAITINSNFELFGAIIARSLVLSSWCRVHFDEALLDLDEGEVPEFELVAFRVLSNRE